ncbi:MAG: hypothetical protein ACE5GE_10290, partial [Phycisphaerae bacterium]
GPAAVQAKRARVPGVRLFWAMLVAFLVTMVEHGVFTGALVGVLAGRSGAWFRYYRQLTELVWRFNGAVLALLVVAIAILTWRARGLRPGARRVTLPLAGMVLASLVVWVLSRLADDDTPVDLLAWQPMWFVNAFRNAYMPGLSSWFSFWEPLWWPMISVGSLNWIIPTSPADRLRSWGGRMDDRAAVWLLAMAVTAAVAGGLGRNARGFNLVLAFTICHGLYTAAMFLFGLAMSRRLIAGRNLFNNQGRPARLVDALLAAGGRLTRR